MSKGVFVHKPDSIYDDFPEERYQFPKRYLKRVTACEGDWIAYYEPAKSGRRGYNAIAKVQSVVPDRSAENMFLAIIEPGSYMTLENFVPHADKNGLFESLLQKDDGSLNMGRVQWAVRPISDRNFSRILNAGFRDDESVLPRTDGAVDQGLSFELSEAQDVFGEDQDRIRLEQTVSRPVRDRVFRKLVLQAYDSRCAITGLKLINGMGRAEVEAAHIKPVEHNGPDVVRNGLALSGTVHWMFDRGLISLSNDADILISRQVNDPEQILGLINKTQKATFPENPSYRPHPAYLSWHRENCFKN